MDPSNQHYALLYLWDLRTIYIGELFELPSFTVAASALLLGLEKPYVLWESESGKRTVTRSTLVPAGVRLNVDSGGQIMAVCFLDPYGQDFELLRQQMRHQLGALWVDSMREDVQLQAFNDIYRDIMPAAQAYESLLQNILTLASVPATMPPVDERLRQALDLIKQNPTLNISNLELAQAVGMSDVQLQRLFKQVIGVPIRRYRLWHRLFVTAGIVASGKSLTEAALIAGFSDSSHFSRTFHSMLSMTPSFVFQRHSRIIINPGDNNEPVRV